MDLTEYYAEVVKTAGLVGPSEDDVKEALAALDLSIEGYDVDLDSVEDVLKTAGLLDEESEDDESEDLSEEKLAACNAVYEQFDIDEIDFDSEEEKQAAAFAIVDGFEKVAYFTPEGKEKMNSAIARDREAGVSARKAEGLARKVEAAKQMKAAGQHGNVVGRSKFLAREKTREAQDAAHRKEYLAGKKAQIGEKGTMKRTFVKAKTKAKHWIGKADETLHGSDINKKLGVSVKNWRRAGTGAAGLAAAGGAAYLMSHKNKHKR